MKQIATLTTFFCELGQATEMILLKIGVGVSKPKKNGHFENFFFVSPKLVMGTGSNVVS